jgi:hypothetical protein
MQRPRPVNPRQTASIESDMEPRETDPDHLDIVWWLVELGRTDRAMYRRVREIAWMLAVENHDSSALPNEAS